MCKAYPVRLEKDSHSLQFFVGLKVGYGRYTSMPEVIQEKKTFQNGMSNSLLTKRAGR